MSPEEITQALQLTKLKDKLWYVAPSVATDGTGIFEGLVSISLLRQAQFLPICQAWLSNNVKTPPAK